MSCSQCGTAYTTRSWYWLDALFAGAGRDGVAAATDTRQCAVPGCCSPVTRPNEIALALSCVGVAASNDVG